jgi:hypothetical protein
MDSCIAGTICWEMMKGVPAGVVTLIIGLIAAGITLRQYYVAKAKLKLDLFEKRYAIFHKTWVAVSAVIQGGTRQVNLGLATPFNNFRPEAAFLFGKDMETYIDELSHNWAELHGLESERADLGGPAGPDRLKNIQRSSELTKWFFEQASTGVKAKFAPYLDFQKWK